MKARRLWLAVHRWLGIVVGPLFVLLGLTGSTLVFDHAIDEWMYPELLMASSDNPPVPLAAMMGAAEAAYNRPPAEHWRHHVTTAQAVSATADTETGAGNQDTENQETAWVNLTTVTSPRVPGGVWTVWFPGRPGTDSPFTAVHVDPAAGVVTGIRDWGHDPMSWIYRLHFRLLSGGVGATLVGLTGIVTLLSILSGVVLWWPLWMHSVRSAFAIRGKKRFTYDLHKTVGITSTALLSLVLLTGVTMEFPGAFGAILELVSEKTIENADHPSATPADATNRLSPEQAIAIARSQYPDAELCHFHPPEGDTGAFEVVVLSDDEVQRSYGRTQMFIDQYSGRILARRLPDDDTAADTIALWQFPLHNGEAFGLLGRWAVFATGLAPAILYASGMSIWFRKRRSRRRPKDGKS